MEKIQALEKAAQEILNGKMESAREVIKTEYPFKKLSSAGRNYTEKQKIIQLRITGHWNNCSGNCMSRENMKSGMG
jgi:hypothetical protein